MVCRLVGNEWRRRTPGRRVGSNVISGNRTDRTRQRRASPRPSRALLGLRSCINAQRYRGTQRKRSVASERYSVAAASVSRSGPAGARLAGNGARRRRRPRVRTTHRGGRCSGRAPTPAATGYRVKSSMTASEVTARLTIRCRFRWVLLTVALREKQESGRQAHSLNDPCGVATNESGRPDDGESPLRKRAFHIRAHVTRAGRSV